MLYVGIILFVVGVLLFIFTPEVLASRGRGKGHPFVIMLLGIVISGISLYKDNVSNSKVPNSSSQSKTS